MAAAGRVPSMDSSTGTSRQPSTSRSSEAISLSIARAAARASSPPEGRKPMPVA